MKVAVFAFVTVLSASACHKPTEQRAGPEPSPTRAASTTIPRTPRPPRPPGSAHFLEAVDAKRFQRGNLHTHTSRSDGDAPPDDVYRWYRDHGYAFVAITDHNQLTEPENRRAVERPGFTTIPGEEITMQVQDRPVHVNALCIKTAITDAGGVPLDRFPTIQASLKWAVGAVLDQGGVALVNHPNFVWVLTADDLPSAHGAQMLEIWSGHPHVHSDGDAEHASEEAIWDATLAMGERFAGVAVDDTHFVRPEAPDPAARPGRGWVEVFASAPRRDLICNALSKGRLYASSGALLKRIVVANDTLRIWPANPGARVEFIGEGGRVLATSQPAENEAAVYRLEGDETYVRAKLTLPDGRAAWTQAYVVGP